MKSPAKLPEGWRITGHGPLGEGVEATDPSGKKVTTAREEDLPRAIREAQS